MKILTIIIAACAIVCAACNSKEKPQKTECVFAHVDNGKFITPTDSSYFFVGTNFWYGAILASTGEGGNRTRLAKELDFMQSIGINNLRILVGSDGDCGVKSKVEPTLQTSPGVYNDTILDGLDYLMSELGKRKMYAVLYLNNSWEWTGGYSQYLAWSGYGKAPIPAVDGWPMYMKYVQQFPKSDTAQALFANYVRDIISRTNRYTKKPYTEDPAIFSWQIGNEPRAFSDENKEAFAVWIGKTAKLIKSLDKNHMISTGSEGLWGCEGDITLWNRIHAYPEISYTNIHIWPYNWSWIKKETMVENLSAAADSTKSYIDKHVALAKKMGKPVVLEEFGFPRDSLKFSLNSPATVRNKYYQFVFDYLLKSKNENGVFAGCNFWGWGGFAQPSTEHVYWQKGDDYTGDPAQEEQGLNSVFAGDEETINLIKTTNEKLKTSAK